MPRKKRSYQDTEDFTARVEFSPAEKSRITREFYKDVKAKVRTGGEYAASKGGFKFALEFDPMTSTVNWKVCIYRTWVDGNAGDVFHALASICARIENRELDKRTARLGEEQ